MFHSPTSQSLRCCCGVWAVGVHPGVVFVLAVTSASGRAQGSRTSAFSLLQMWSIECSSLLYRRGRPVTRECGLSLSLVSTRELISLLRDPSDNEQNQLRT